MMKPFHRKQFPLDGVMHLIPRSRSLTELIEFVC
jgi:hypothetical protein